MLKLRTQRHKRGTVRFDKRRGTWHYLWYEGKKRPSKVIGTKQQYPTKAAAWKAVTVIEKQQEANHAPTVHLLVEHYRKEKMPTRHDTRGGYESWLRVYILPNWGDATITELQARPVELWLESLPLAPKSKVHIRGILNALWNYAMWRQDVPMQVNPISLVTIKGASKRIRKPRVLTVEQFRLRISHLKEPFNTLALMCVLRPSHQ